MTRNLVTVSQVAKRAACQGLDRDLDSDAELIEVARPTLGSTTIVALPMRSSPVPGSTGEALERRVYGLSAFSSVRFR
jgi:hypothetical protein